MSHNTLKVSCSIGSIAIHLHLSHFHICNIIRVTMSLKYCNKILGVRTAPPQKCLIKIPHHPVSKHLLIIFQCNKLASHKVVAHVIQLNENEGLWLSQRQIIPTAVFSQLGFPFLVSFCHHDYQEMSC